MNNKTQKVLDACINKQLEPYGITVEDVRKNPYVKRFKLQFKTILFGFLKYPTFYEKVNWFQYYTFKSKEQFEDWKTFCILEMISKLKMSKEKAEHEFNWLNLQYGLKQDYGNKG